MPVARTTQYKIFRHKIILLSICSRDSYWPMTAVPRIGDGEVVSLAGKVGTGLESFVPALGRLIACVFYIVVHTVYAPGS